MNDSLTTIPEETPDAAPVPGYRETPENFAEGEKHEETVEKVLKAAQDFWTYFKGQPERKSALDLMNDADRMHRVSQQRDETSDQKRDTTSNVTSTSYFRRVRRRTTEAKSILLGGAEDLPVMFAPEDQSNEADRQIADDQTAYLRHVMDQDNVRFKIGQSIHYATKYANELVSVEWDYRVEDREERVLKPSGKKGKLVAKWKTTRKTIANNPTYIRHDLKDAWFDARIDDIQKQRCLELRDQVGWEVIEGEKLAGHYVNIDKIDKSKLYQGEGTETTLADRKTNAGETHSEEPNGLFDRYNVWIRVPVNEKGKWDEKKTSPAWHWATFIGALDSEPVCVRLIANPYKHKRLPYLLAHTHEDDKGAFHMGMPDILACNYEEECTTINQMVDNKDLGNEAPWIIEKGAILKRDLTFGRNKVFTKKAGAPNPEQMDVRENSQNTIAVLGWVKSDGDQAAMTEGAMEGQALGGRASASEAKTVFEQQTKPVVEDAAYLGDQILPFYARDVIELAQQYLNPDEAMQLNVAGVLRNFNPTSIYGPIHVRVVSVREYEKNAVRRLEETTLLSTTLPVIAQLSPETTKQILKQVYKNRKFDGVDNWFTERNDAYDAMQDAKSENDTILFQGVYDMPKSGENHAAHLQVHKPMRALYATLPEENQNAANLRTMDIHIATHVYFEQRGQAQLQTAAAGMAGPGAPQPGQGDGVTGTAAQPPAVGPGAPMMDGQAMGDQMAGAMGAQNG
jgi:hypothetical protein